MLDSHTNNHDEIDQIFNNYLDSLPNKKHTSTEQEKLVSRIEERLKFKNFVQKENVSKNLLQSLAEKFKKLFALPPKGSSKPYLQPAFYAAIVIILICTASIYYLSFDKSNVQTTGKIRNKFLSSKNKNQETSTGSTAKNDLKLEINGKTEINQIGVIPFRINQKALTESKVNIFEQNSVLIQKLFNITIEILKNKDIKINSILKNKIITEWFYYRSGGDGTIRKSRIIASAEIKEHPEFIFKEEWSKAENTASITVLDINIRNLIKEIKSKYFNHYK